MTNVLRMLSVLCAIAVTSGAAPVQRFTIAAMQQIAAVSDAVISPDGSRIAYVASRTDLEHNRYDDTLYLYDRRAKTSRTLAPGHRSVDALAWSPDGSALAAVLDTSGSDADQLYIIDPVSGAMRQLTHGSTGVDEIAWSPSGTFIAFSRRDAEMPRTGAAAYRDAFEVGDNAYLVTKRTLPVHLWLAARHGSTRRLTSGIWSVAGSPLSWSPDGTRLLFERAPNGIHGVQDRTRAAVVTLRDRHVADLMPQLTGLDNALYSPDGKSVAYRLARGGNPVNASDAYAGRRDLTKALDRHVESLAWMPGGKSLLLSVYDRTQAPLYIQPLTGTARRLHLGPVMEASIDPAQSVARDGTIVFTGSERGRPDELYVLERGAAAPQRLTAFNDATARLQLGRAVRVTWRNDGMEEDGVLTYPPGYRAGQKYPLVLRIHGGPTESSMIAFEPFYQLAAARGYLVFAPNYRGSNDLGNRYEAAIFNDASAGPGRDIMAGIAAVERMGIVDRPRIGVSGWSYGGQLTSWMESHYHIWKAAVAGAAVNDLVVDYAIADDIDADSLGFSGGSPYKGNALGRWQAASPITYFKRIRTPTLILCNVYDVRVPIVESYEMYHALKDNGVPVRFYAYPSTGHLPNGPVRLADAYEKWLSWFDRYLKGRR